MDKYPAHVAQSYILSNMSQTQAYLYLSLVAATVIGLFVFLTWQVMFFPASSETSESVKKFEPIPQPPYTAEVEAQLAASSGFQALISYTYRGFEPKSLAVERGDTLRFTNNTHGELWVASEGTPYPAGKESCGSSGFDSCRVLSPGEFWEFTFERNGTWPYVNNLDKSNRAVVIVQ